MPQCPDTIKRLIDRFAQQSDTICSPDYNETLIRIDFINPLMSELGWDIDNHQGFAEQYREVVHEDRVRVAGQTKAPDYSFRIGGARKFFLEAKKPAVDIKNSWEPAYQLRRYAWSAKLACSLLTDFEEFAIYDTRIQPKQLERASVARREFISYTQYADRWDFISGTFSKDAVLRGEFDRYCPSQKGRGAQAFDEAFLAEIEEWRKAIAASLARNNANLDESSLNFAVQRIIDRIIFLRIAEDRGTETVGQLQSLLNGEKVFARLNEVFRRADERYNSGLFHFAKEKDRDETPDELTPALDVDDRTLKAIIKALYYPASPYEFTMVSADILGSIYERFLGKVITLTAGHNAKIEEKPEVRKAGGVYYTPTYIVDYIVKNTVGELLEGKTPKEAAKLKILDPACGSGSFLIGAYQFLLDWYHTQYTGTAGPGNAGVSPAFSPATLATGKNPVLRPARDGGWALTIAERKRILLDHIHGVDLDSQAVEVTKLNLLLKCLEGETSQTLGFEQRLFRERALPDLGKNIQCGNSLIGTDIIGTDAWNAMSEEERRRINPFDYERAFPAVFKGKDAGFDVVIGNPPYVRPHNIEPHIKECFWTLYTTFVGKSDLYCCFVENGIRLLRRGGLYGNIIGNGWLRLDSFESLRKLLLAHTSLLEILDFEGNVFDQATVSTAVVLLQKDAANKEHALRIAACLAGSIPEATAFRKVPQTNFTSTYKCIFDLSSGGGLDGVKVKMRMNGLPIGERFALSFGLKTGDDAKFLSKSNVSPDHRPLLRGEDVHRYQSAFKGEYVWYVPDQMTAHRRTARPGNRARFEQPKILVRDTGGGLQGTLDDANYYVKDVLVIADPQRDRSELAFLTGVLFSKLMRVYYETSFPTLHVQRDELASLPAVLNGSDATRVAAKQRIVALVDSMLSLHKRLAAEQLPQRKEQLQREIDATDRQIDQLVYHLYALTPDEIRIVEEATK